jgi:hypothetical protein
MTSDSYGWRLPFIILGSVIVIFGLKTHFFLKKYIIP